MRRAYACSEVSQCSRERLALHHKQGTQGRKWGRTFCVSLHHSLTGKARQEMGACIHYVDDVRGLLLASYCDASLHHARPSQLLFYFTGSEKNKQLGRLGTRLLWCTSLAGHTLLLPSLLCCRICWLMCAHNTIKTIPEIYNSWECTCIMYKYIHVLTLINSICNSTRS